jgi:hypothetical protein
MAKNTVPVKLFNAALDDAEDSPAGVVIRGALDVASLHHLLRDDYQREAQPLTSQWRILDALKSGSRLPDVDLGMRGEDFSTRESSFFLKDPTYIIDGVQRISTIIHYIATNPGSPVRIGATVHLNTTKDWERERFRKLNNWRSKLSPNILLRNMRETNPGILMLYGVSMNDKSFVLHRRVSWDQRMKKGELITARTLAKTVANLHGHKVSSFRNNVDELGDGIKKLVEVVGVQAVRENIRNFFDLIDIGWGIKSVQYKEGAMYMRGNFLFMLSRLLSDHRDFWQDASEKRLFINADLRRKIAQFPIHDPEIARLAGSSGSASKILYGLLLEHINKGKTTKRLTARAAIAALELDDDDEEDEAA